MKKTAFALAVTALLLSACGSTKDVYQQRAEAIQERQERAVDRVIDQAPKWMAELPKSTDAVYASGTAASGDYNMAMGIARTNAYEAICMAAGGQVTSQTKVFRTDTESVSSAFNTTAIKSMCPYVDITGVEVKETKMVRENGRFRSYVLVALPMGQANVLARTKDNNRLINRAMTQRDQEFRELDARTPKQ
jgi:hypothetical protein